MLLNEENKRMLKEYPGLIEMIELAEGKNDNETFFKLRKQKKEVIKHFCNELSLTYDRNKHYNLIDIIIKILSAHVKNATEIILFKDFANQYQWDNEKVELFHNLNHSCGQRNRHIKKWYTGIEYVKLESYEFIVKK